MEGEKMQTREAKISLLTGLLNGTVKPSELKPRFEVRYFEDKETVYIMDGKQTTEDELHKELAKEPVLTHNLIVCNPNGTENLEAYYYD